MHFGSIIMLVLSPIPSHSSFISSSLNFSGTCFIDLLLPLFLYDKIEEDLFGDGMEDFSGVEMKDIFGYGIYFWGYGMEDYVGEISL